MLKRNYTTKPLAQCGILMEGPVVNCVYEDGQMGTETFFFFFFFFLGYVCRAGNVIGRWGGAIGFF